MSIKIELPKTMPADPQERKKRPVFTGVIKYFPNALLAIAQRSLEGNEIHHPGTDLHWDKSKSQDEMDALIRHAMEGDWVAVAWRALAQCERELTKDEDNEVEPSKDLPKPLSKFQWIKEGGWDFKGGLWQRDNQETRCMEASSSDELCELYDSYLKDFEDNKIET